MEIECNPNPSGRCFCGCGQKTNIAEKDQPPWAVKGKPRMYLGGHFFANGGERFHENGYRLIRRPNHPRADAGGYVREHHLVVEEAIGKPVPEGAVVHHIDGDVTNNEPSNLVLCEDNAYHLLLHRRQARLEATDDPDAIRCGFCGEFDGEMYVYPNDRKGYHPECRRGNKSVGEESVARELTCEACGAKWERRRQDGRTPSKCPECAPWRDSDADLGYTYRPDELLETK